MQLNNNYLNINNNNNVVENMLFIIIQSYRTSQQIDLNFDLLGMGIYFEVLNNRCYLFI